VRQLATLNLDEVRDVTVAKIAGEIDLSDAGELQATISDAVPNHAAGLVVELSEVTYLDSTGVALLFELARRVARRQQALGIVVPREAPVREILHLSGADDALTLHDELEDALEQISPVAGER
jgi:anti-anti-sigma factor